MADLIEEPCSSCRRKSVEVEFKYLHPWRLAIVEVVSLLGALGLAKLLYTFVPLSHEWRLGLCIITGSLFSGVLRRLLAPRVAKRTAHFRCRLCGDASSRPAIHGLGIPSKA